MLQQITCKSHRLSVRIEPYFVHSGFPKAVTLISAVAFNKIYLPVIRNSDIHAKVGEQGQTAGQVSCGPKGQIQAVRQGASCCERRKYAPE